MPLKFLAYITAEDDPTLLLYRAPGADGPNLVASVMDATTESTREEVRTEFAAQLRKWADRLDGIEQPGAADLTRAPR